MIKTTQTTQVLFTEETSPTSRVLLFSLAIRMIQQESIQTYPFQSSKKPFLKTEKNQN